MAKEYVSKEAALACVRTLESMIESLCDQARDIERLLKMAQTVEVEYEDGNETDKGNSEEEAD